MDSLRWSTDIKQWDKLTKDTAVLILNQSESLLRETVESAKIISAKADKLISILIPIESGIVIYILDSSKNKEFDFLSLTAILSFIVVGLSLFFAFKNFQQYNISVTGFHPNTTLISPFIDTDYLDGGQYINMVYNICENLQERITINLKLNAKRTFNNRIAIQLLFILPTCPILSYLFFLIREIRF